jgi:hypothetical protein
MAIMNFGCFLYMGVNAATAFATADYCLHPKRWKEFGNSKSYVFPITLLYNKSVNISHFRSTLPFQQKYLLPMVFFPFTASAIQVSVLLKVDAVIKGENIICEAMNPIWLVRLLIKVFTLAFSPFIFVKTINSLYL